MLVKVTVVFMFRIDDKWRKAKDHLRYIINGAVRENVEQRLPEEWVMKVVKTNVDGNDVENDYE